MIQILEETTKYPITLMGMRAGVCWGADTTDSKKNYKRGLDCLESGHGRVMEYVNIEMIISGYSARVMREWYTHIGGLPTRLQESTRYINEEYFDYVKPASVIKSSTNEIYDKAMKYIQETYQQMLDAGVPKEDCSLILPLGMKTKVVDKRNLRNLVDMAHQRTCNRAYWEYRKLMFDICEALKEYSTEWHCIVTEYMLTKCEVVGYCTEKNGCGRRPKKEA